MTPEPMVTIKKTDGTTQRVPLSLLKKNQESGTQNQGINPQPSLQPPRQVQQMSTPAQGTKNILVSGSVEQRSVQTPKGTNDSGVTKLKEGVTERPQNQPPPSPPKRSSVTFDMLKPTAQKSMSENPPQQKPPMPKPPIPSKQAAAATPPQPIVQRPPAPPKPPTGDAKPASISPSSRAWDMDDHASLLDESLHQDLPMVSDSHKRELSTTTPVKDVFKNEARADSKYQIKNNKNKIVNTTLKQDTRPPAGETGNAIQSFHQNPSLSRMSEGGLQTGSTKPILHDVKPGTGIPQTASALRPAPVSSTIRRTMGPVEELEALTLQDFRRLGGSLEAMTKILTEKFRGLRKESFLLYADGVRAWRNSPLYKEYLQAIAQSLQQRRPVDVVLAGEKGLKQEEFKALMGINKQLGM